MAAHIFRAIRLSLCGGFSHSYFILGRRTLFSSEILGIENFKRMRIFWNDRLGENRDRFIESISASRDDESRKRRACDVVQLVYIAQTNKEVSLITDLLKDLQWQRNGTSTSSSSTGDEGEALTDDARSAGAGPIHFGPLLMRLLFVLGQRETALNLWDNEELKPLFQNATCYLLLMDMLYEGTQYEKVVSTFYKLQEASLSAIQFPPDCTTLALAALYQTNTQESFEQMKAILGKAKQVGNTVSRRSVLFAVALAIKQGENEYALSLIENTPKQNETLLRNMKIMAQAGCGKLEESIALIENGLWTDVPTLSRVGIMFSDTMGIMAEQVKAANNPLITGRFEQVRKMLDSEGMLSPQTVEHFVTRTILLQRKRDSSRRSFKTKVKTPVKQLQHN